MTQLLQAKGGSLSVMDALEIAVAKSLSERLLSPLVGNGTLMSGAIKIGSAVFLLGGNKSSLWKILGTAVMVDGGEDIITSFLGGAITNIGSGITTNSKVQVL